MLRLLSSKILVSLLSFPDGDPAHLKLSLRQGFLVYGGAVPPLAGLPLSLGPVGPRTQRGATPFLGHGKTGVKPSHFAHRPGSHALSKP